MAAWNDLLIRDSIGDTGTVPSPGYPYTSPDVICTQQTTYADPTGQFGTGASYGQDPNLPVVASQNNFFYMRAKNLGTASQGGQAYLYWTRASLIMTPGLWFSQPLSVQLNQQWQNDNPLAAVGQNGIAVTQQPFAWTPPPLAANDHYCMVGAVGTATHPWPPAQAPTFPSYEAFALWVRNNQNVCWRNLTLVSNPNTPQWDRVDGLYNEWNQDTPLLVSAQCTNVPVGTQVTLRCTALGIDTTQTTTATSQTVYAQGVTCPAGFNGYVETSAVLPAGTQWPAGALIRTTAYFAAQQGSPIAAFAFDFGDDIGHPHVRAALDLAGGPEAGVLVEVGNCATTYTGSQQG